MKISLTICSVLVAIVVCEPPAPNRYLPPNQNAFHGGPPSQAYGPPSQQYGAPGFGNGGVIGDHDGNGYSGRPSTAYGAPSAPSSNYGAPNGPSQVYGAPSFAGNGFAGRPSSVYGAPGNGFGRKVNGFNRRPSFGFGGSNGFARRPSSSYGAPNALAVASLKPSPVYGPPGTGNGGYGRGGNGYDDLSEPANYQFEYMVKDEPSGNDFGHQEARQGDQAYGRYYVVLPDGRKQIVDYEADADGYRPKISYEEGYPVNGGGYGRGPANGGYQNGGYAHNGGYSQNGRNGGYAHNGGYNY